MAKKNVGAALNAVPDDEDTPLRSIMSGAGDALLGDENSRRALLQIGLQMMQPVAMGQSVAGHIGQGIGAGGEAVGRIEAQELARTKQEDELEKSQRMLDIRQQEANAYGTGQRAAAARGAVTDRLTLEHLKQQGRAALQGTKDYLAIGKHTSDLVNDVAFDTKDPANADLLKYKGKDAGQIAEMKRAEEAAKTGGATATPQTKSQDDEARAWALANPSDPRAAKIRQRLGM